MTEIENIMQLLGCSEEQAKQVIEDDKRIDKGEKLFELTAEQQAVAKKYRQGDRKPTVYNFNTRERKADNDKRELIALLNATLDEVATCEPTVTNPERQIDFLYKGKKYRVVLSAPRT
jgi:ribosome-binding ATPase YchF (GTP1/OBG family)